MSDDHFLTHPDGSMTFGGKPVHLNGEDGGLYAVTFQEEGSLGVSWGRAGTQKTWGNQDGESWSMEFPCKGTDLTWIEDPEQELDNWRTYHTADGWYTLLLKHDGCVEIEQAANIPFWIGDHKLTDQERDRINHDCDDFIHICDIDQYANLIRTVVPLAEAWETRPR